MVTGDKKIQFYQIRIKITEGSESGHLSSLGMKEATMSAHQSPKLTV